MSFTKLATALLVASVAVLQVSAESHTVTLVNNCGKGTPVLKQNGNTLSTGGDYTANGPLSAAISYLDTGCGANGDGCTLVETTLQNPTTAGSGSSTDISLIAPLAFSVKATFAYKNGCTNGKACDSADCTTAFHQSTDTTVQEACQANDAGLTITYC
ncbi:hypothetical protein PLICRDRAFT_32989 [Plicaturopsis crispa FD-325 SS-3]|uniref:Glycopeptide n=1 Tax=Plicaturopsis crispa FD-325 SS-3 TaxID=944288 RepID=A0A0C9T240_PLICR|nr:hypothetical protein PLICRDRAFT_32989 [Plicaturopsis crispa FD-325 SS-3]